jgi:hypothetical protein
MNSRTKESVYMRRILMNKSFIGRLAIIFGSLVLSMQFLNISPNTFGLKTSNKQ